MADRFPLKETRSQIDPSTWAELNENWDRIRSYLRHLQSQIKLLAGGQEIDEVINRIEIAISNAQNVTESANEAIAILNVELPKLITAINNANTAISNADDAINSAINATSAANVAAVNATEVTNLAIDAADGANSAKTDAEQAATNANAATNDALEATDLATDAKNETIAATNDALSAITEMRQLISNVLHRGDWNSATNYYKNNLVSANGQTYIAVQNNINKVVTDTTNWRLFAAKGERGEKGETGAALSILDQLTSESQLPATGEPGEAYTVNGDLYVWSENSNQWINVGNIKGEKGEAGLSAYQIALVDGFIGTETEWLESLKGERGEKGNNGSDASVTKTNITNALGYTPADNEDLTQLESEFSSHSALTEQTLTNHESRLNQLESGASSAKADVAGLNREVAYLKLKQDASERIEGGTVFADDFKGNRFGFTLDEANSSGFKIKNGKMVMAKDEPTNYSVTDGIVVASAYSTAGNGGRKLIMLNNGWLFTAAYDASNTRLLGYVSKDKGKTWENKYIVGSELLHASKFALVALGQNVGVLYAYSNSHIRFRTYNESGRVSTVDIDSTQTEINDVSVVRDENNGHLHAAWASKNATYPNSFNIRYSKSTDGGVTWSAVEQLSVFNNSAINNESPSISVRNGVPIVISSYRNTSPNANQILCFYKNDSNWNQNIVYNGGTYTQSNPSAVVDKDGVIHVVWHGRDATLSANVVRYSKSVDGEIIWTPMERLSSVNETLDVPSITVDRENRVRILCSHYPTGSVESFYYNGVSWIRTRIKTTTTSTRVHPSALVDLSLSVSTPLLIYQDTSKVGFYGEWTEYVEVPTTTATAIYNIPSTDYVGAFVQKAGNLTVTAQLNATPMETELENNEYQFIGSLASSAPATLRLELSRPNTTGGENDAVTRILGGRS